MDRNIIITPYFSYFCDGVSLTIEYPDTRPDFIKQKENSQFNRKKPDICKTIFFYKSRIQQAQEYFKYVIHFKSHVSH